MPAAARSASSSDPVTTEQATATAQAAATNTPVAIDALTDENSQVSANPDGTFTLDSYREAVRVEHNGQWVPVDTTLEANPDGTISPAATTQDIQFSGGGSGPAVTVTEDGARVSTSLPVPLPAPSITGDTATYAAVLPGTDLTLTAQPEGYTFVLVVHNAAAATNPELTNLRLRLAATGVDVNQGTDGSMTATSPDGSVVFSSPPPTMWDSTASAAARAAGDLPTADDPASGVVHLVDASDLDLDAAHSTAPVTADLTLTPPPAALSGPDVVYPVYIDPAMTGARSTFRVVRDNNYANYSTNSDVLRVGYCDWGGECAGGAANARSYFYLSTSALLAHPNPTIFSATVSVTQVHNGGCTGTPVSLWSSYSFTPDSTNWPGPAAAALQTSGNVSFGGNSTCPEASADILFSGAKVVSQIQDVADAGRSSAALALISPREGDKYAWKKFGNNPKLSATFAWADPVPAGRDFARIDCTGVVYVNDATPTFYAATDDYNDNAPNLEFDLYNAAGQHWGKTVASGGNGQQAGWTAPTLPSGVTYAWRVRGVTGYGDNVLNGDWSTSISFIVDTSPPSTPVSTSYDYPPDLWGAATGKSIRSKAASGGPAGYAFGWDGAAPNLTSTTCNYTAAANARTGYDVDGLFTVPADLPPGKHTLNVVAFDGAHNASASSAYSFYISPTITAGAGTTPPATRLEGEDLTVDSASGSGVAALQYVETTIPWTSGGKQLHIVPRTSPVPPSTIAPSPAGQQVSLLFDVAVEGDYALSSLMTTADHYGEIKFAIDDKPVVLNSTALLFNGYSTATPSPQTQRWVDLGGSHLSVGQHRFSIILIGHTASNYNDPTTGTDDQGYAVGLDLLTVAPVNNITTASFSDALNNHGIVDTDRATDAANTSANLGYSAGKSNLALAALQSVGLNRSSSVAVDGVPFTLAVPKSAAGGYADNVVAMGQTIPIGPSPKPLKSVDLMVVAACGDVAPPATSTSLNYVLSKFTLNHQDPPAAGEPPVTSTPNVPTVTDFYTQASTSSTRVTYAAPANPASAFIVSGSKLPYIDRGTNPDTAVTPWIYHLKIPINPNYATNPVRSLTLPNIGTSFVVGNCRPSLHVLAMTPVPAT